MNILHLTTIIPVPSSFKKFNNDILIRIASEYEKKFHGSKHHFILIVPYSNWFFALFKTKWKDYVEMIRKGSVESEGYQITVVGMPGIRYDIHLRKPLARLGYKLFNERIRKTIQHIKPDIVHAHNMLSTIELAELIKRDYGINYLVTARSIDHRILNRIQKGKLNPSAIISHNQVATKRCDRMGVPVNLITHPIDNVFFKETGSISKASETQLKIISVCGLIKLKNINRVIDALKMIGSGFTYTIIGDGPERENLEALARSHNLENRIIFAGFTPHETIPQLLADHDLFVMPSFPETLGRVYFEAMASGIPVIATKNTGIDGMIEHQVHGYLVNHNSVDEIKDAILHFMALSPEQKMQMKRNATAYAQHFTWDAVLEKYFEVYDNYCSQKT